jgi:hypothetical protein
VNDILVLVEQLKQLLTVTADGNLLSKSARTRLVNAGYVERINGFNFLTKDGVKVLIDFGLLYA